MPLVPTNNENIAVDDTSGDFIDAITGEIIPSHKVPVGTQMKINIPQAGTIPTKFSEATKTLVRESTNLLNKGGLGVRAASNIAEIPAEYLGEIGPKVNPITDVDWTKGGLNIQSRAGASLHTTPEDQINALKTNNPDIDFTMAEGTGDIVYKLKGDSQYHPLDPAFFRGGLFKELPKDIIEILPDIAEFTAQTIGEASGGPAGASIGGGLGRAARLGLAQTLYPTKKGPNNIESFISQRALQPLASAALAYGGSKIGQGLSKGVKNLPGVKSEVPTSFRDPNLPEFTLPPEEPFSSPFSFLNKKGKRIIDSIGSGKYGEKYNKEALNYIDDTFTKADEAMSLNANKFIADKQDEIINAGLKPNATKKEITNAAEPLLQSFKKFRNENFAEKINTVKTAIGETPIAKEEIDKFIENLNKIKISAKTEDAEGIEVLLRVIQDPEMGVKNLNDLIDFKTSSLWDDVFDTDARTYIKSMKSAKESYNDLLEKTIDSSKHNDLKSLKNQYNLANQAYSEASTLLSPILNKKGRINTDITDYINQIIDKSKFIESYKKLSDLSEKGQVSTNLNKFIEPLRNLYGKYRLIEIREQMEKAKGGDFSALNRLLKEIKDPSSNFGKLQKLFEQPERVNKIAGPPITGSFLDPEEAVKSLNDEVQRLYGSGRQGRSVLTIKPDARINWELQPTKPGNLPINWGKGNVPATEILKTIEGMSKTSPLFGESGKRNLASAIASESGKSQKSMTIEFLKEALRGLSQVPAITHAPKQYLGRLASQQLDPLVSELTNMLNEHIYRKVTEK